MSPSVLSAASDERESAVAGQLLATSTVMRLRHASHTRRWAWLGASLSAPFLLSVLTANVEADDAAPWSTPRELPSLIVRWERPGEPCALAIRDGIVYVLEPGRVVAVDQATGRPRWEHAIETGICPFHWQNPLLTLDGVVVVAAEDRLYVVDRASGTRLHTLPLGGRFSQMWGPSVLVEAGERRERDLLAIDPIAGRVTGRQRFESGIYDLQTVGEHVLVTSPSPGVAGFRLPGLTPVWSTSGFTSVGLLAGQPVLGRQVSEDGCVCEEVVPVAAENGRTGAPLFRRRSSDPRQEPPWELEFLESEAGSILRRLRPADGQPLWQIELPDQVTAWAQEGPRLYAQSGRSGRGYLLVIDSASGRLMRGAYGRRDVYDIEASGDSLVLLTGEGLVTVASTEFGRPEADTLPVAEAVGRILAAPVEYWDRDQVYRDLEALGSDALPVLTAAIPRLSGWLLAVAASRLAAAGHREAAPALAARLKTRDASKHRDSVEAEVLDALAALAGPGDVAALRTVLQDAERSDGVRFHASMALATIGTPDAMEAVALALDDRRRRLKTRVLPPSAADFLDLIDRPVDEPARNQAAEREDFAEWGRLGRGIGAARVPLGGGRALVLFPDGALGNERDIWAQEVTPEGAVAGDSIFLGVSVSGPECDESCPIITQLNGSALTVRRRDGQGPLLRVDLASARLDHDGDGLSDLAEARLGTDAGVRDTDRDTIVDSQDPFPGAAASAPASDIEQATAAIFEQYHLFATDTRELAIFVSDTAPPVSGREGPTLVVGPKALEAFKASTRFDGAPFITLAPVDTGGAAVAGQIAAFTRGSVAYLPDLKASDRRYSFTIYRGPLNAVGYDVVVRKTERGWLVRYLRQAWIS
jgi:hypothetical protein